MVHVSCTRVRSGFRDHCFVSCNRGNGGGHRITASDALASDALASPLTPSLLERNFELLLLDRLEPTC